MALSPTEIVNQALDLLGEATIASFNDDSTTARLANRHYNRLLYELLADHPWNFATWRENLAVLSDAPAWGFAYKYQLPADYIQARRINAPSRRQPYRVEGLTIMTDLSGPLPILYTRKVENPNYFAPLFVSALVHRLAHAMCMPLTASTERANGLWTQAESVLRRARSANAQEGTPEDMDDGDFIDVRS